MTFDETKGGATASNYLLRLITLIRFPVLLLRLANCGGGGGDRFEQVTDMPLAVSEARALLLPDGSVLPVGAFLGRATYTAAAQRFISGRR